MNDTDRHKVAAPIEHLIGVFHRIKTLSSNAEIDRLCVDGISKLLAIVDANGLQKELDDLRDRRIDPTM